MHQTLLNSETSEVLASGQPSHFRIGMSCWVVTGAWSLGTGSSLSPLAHPRHRTYCSAELKPCSVSWFPQEAETAFKAGSTVPGMQTQTVNDCCLSR